METKKEWAKLSAISTKDNVFQSYAYGTKDVEAKNKIHDYYKKWKKKKFSQNINQAMAWLSANWSWANINKQWLGFTTPFLMP